jgi:hypothetical protein
MQNGVMERHMAFELELLGDDGGTLISESDLPLTDNDLDQFGISRKDFDRCWAEGRKLMQDYKPSDRVRPCVMQALDWSWVVEIVGYSQLSDPLMQDEKGTNH